MDKPSLNVSAIARWAAALILLSSLGFAAPIANLSGRWILNTDLSDDPLQKREEAFARKGGAPPSGGPGGRRGNSPPEGPRPDVEGFFESFEFLEIVHQDPKLLITDAVGREHTLFTDNRKTEEERSGGTARLRAKWEDGRVVVRTRPAHGPSFTETYLASADGQQLTVVMEIEGRGSMPDITIRRVYDATTEPAPHSTSEY